MACACGDPNCSTPTFACPGCAALTRENEFLREQVKTLLASALAMADPLAAARAATMTAQASRIATPTPRPERKPPSPPHLLRQRQDQPSEPEVQEYYDIKAAERTESSPVAAEPTPTRAEIEDSFKAPEA